MHGSGDDPAFIGTPVVIACTAAVHSPFQIVAATVPSAVAGVVVAAAAAYDTHTHYLVLPLR